MKRRAFLEGLAAAAVQAGLGWPRIAGAQQPGRDAPPLIILVAFDTTRADHLGCYGYHRDTTPNLDRFAAEAVLFERCHAQSNETLTSFASMFQGRWSSELGSLSYERFRLNPDVLTLAEILGIHGYQTGAFVAGGHLVRAFGHDRGFDTYRDEWHFGSFYHTMPPALDWLDQRDPNRPGFLFVHGYDTHGPYAPPLWFQDLFDPDYQGLMDDLLKPDLPLDIEKVWRDRYYGSLGSKTITRLLDDPKLRVLPTDLFSLLALQDPADGDPVTLRDKQHVVAHYDGALVYADLLFGRFLDELAARGLLDNSIIIVMGDHGEDLFEHDHVNHRISLHDASTHVPLIIRLPGGAWGGSRVSELVGLTDLLPTLLELGSITLPALIRGRSLLPLIRGEAPDWPAYCLSEGIMPMASLRGEEHRLVLNGFMAGSDEYMQFLHQGITRHEGISLFALGPEGEQRMAPDSPETQRMVTSMLGFMREAYHGFRSPQGGMVPYVDPLLMQLMRDKGYW